MLDKNSTALVIIDVQERLMNVIFEKEKLIQNLVKLIEGAKVLGLPIIWTEQYPKGLGETIPELKSILEEIKPIEKIHFSCCGEPNFRFELEKVSAHTLLVAGIESHVCVYQTVADLIDSSFQVEVVTDAISSRTKESRELGIKKCNDLGASLTSVEMCLFELLEQAGTFEFKAISKIVK
ncbi:MAG: hydrolase [Calditrichaeota bacterium]|nr:MAG: hydrolase [Calditrichota bacterium]